MIGGLVLAYLGQAAFYAPKVLHTWQRDGRALSTLEQSWIESSMFVQTWWWLVAPIGLVLVATGVVLLLAREDDAR